MLLRMLKDVKCSFFFFFPEHTCLFVIEILVQLEKKSSGDYTIRSDHGKMLCYEDGEIQRCLFNEVVVRIK